MRIRLTKWDVVEHLQTRDDMVDYLDACLAENDPTLIAAALGDIARVRGMTQVAHDTGLSRESLYRALSGKGNPAFSTIIKVVKALGLSLHSGNKAVVS
jgi:probable addiction module antidote protein